MLSDLLAPTERFPRLVPFSAAAIERSLHFWADADVVGTIGRLMVGHHGSYRPCEVQPGLQNSARAICLLGVGCLEEVGQSSVIGLPYSQTQNLMERLTFRCLVGMLPGLCILLMHLEVWPLILPQNLAPGSLTSRYA